MERFLKWLDDLDDLLAVVRTHSSQLLVTGLLLAAFATAVGFMLVYGPPDLLAAP